MRLIYRLKNKFLGLLVISIFIFSSETTAQVFPATQNFTGFGGSNNITGPFVSFPNSGKYLVFTTVLPTVTTGNTRAFLGNPGAVLFPVHNASPTNITFVFNYTNTGAIPASGLPGNGDYRVKFTPAVDDTTTTAGDFYLQTMYMAIGNGNVGTVTIQGFRGGRVMASGSVMFDQGAPSSNSSATDITYTTSIDGQAGLTLTFGSNWQFLDAIRITTTNTNIPVLVDDLTFAGPTEIAPTSRASSIGFTQTGITSGVSWTNGNGDATAVFVTAGNSGSPTFPGGGTVTHTASTAFGSGTQAGTGWYCVYKGTGTSTTITNLTAGTDYRAIAVTYNGSGGYETHNVTEGSGLTSNIKNFTTIAIPSQASGGAASNITHQTATLTWTAGGGNQRTVFVKNTGSGTPAPVFNTGYTAITVMGSGGQITTTGWYAVYRGTGTTVSISNLLTGQPYRAMVIEFNDNNLGTTFSTYNISNGGSNIIDFTTDNFPVVVSTAAGSVTHNGAVINGTINDNGDNTAVSFQYSQNSSLTPSTTIAGSPLTVTAGSGVTSVSATLSALNPSTVYYFRPRGVNAVGVATGSILSLTTAPAIQLTTSSLANGSYKEGQVIPIQVVFTGAVTVTGLPTLALSTGGTATYASGSGSNTITFNYTVLAGHSSTDLNYTSTSALSLNGGTIRNANSIDAFITLPSPAAIGSLGGQKALWWIRMCQL
jgi:fibronectin-binding autotransporter adhesin